MAAAGLESLIYEKRGEERDAEEKGGQGPSKKPRCNAAEHRPAWVKGSVAEAVRRDSGGQSGAPFKQPPGWRGTYQTGGASGSGTEAVEAAAAAVAALEPAEGEPTAGGGTESPGGTTKAEGSLGECPTRRDIF